MSKVVSVSFESDTPSFVGKTRKNKQTPKPGQIGNSEDPYLEPINNNPDYHEYESIPDVAMEMANLEYEPIHHYENYAKEKNGQQAQRNGQQAKRNGQQAQRNGQQTHRFGKPTENSSPYMDMRPNHELILQGKLLLTA